MTAPALTESCAPEDPDAETWGTVSEAAALCQLSPKAVRAQIARGVFPARARKLANQWRICLSDLRDFFSEAQP